MEEGGKMHWQNECKYLGAHVKSLTFCEVTTSEKNLRMLKHASSSCMFSNQFV